MTVTVQLSETKERLLGEMIVKMFNLKVKDGTIKTELGKMSTLGLGRSILMTVEDAIKHDEVELARSLRENW